jgi:hypothetical protein
MPTSTQEALAKVNQAAEQLAAALSEFTSNTADAAQTQINEGAATAADTAKSAIDVAQDQLSKALTAVKAAIDKVNSPPGSHA